MPLIGQQMLPRDVLRLLYDNHWQSANILMTMGCIVYAESNGYDHAFHWNDPAEKGDGSTDWGLFQLNDGNKGGVSPDKDGSPNSGGIKVEAEVQAFRDMAWNPQLAAQYARNMYVARGFQPWAAYGNLHYRMFIDTMCRGMCNMLSVLNGGKPLI